MDKVTLSPEQNLYVLQHAYGYTCLGYDVLMDRYARLSAAMDEDPLPAYMWGTLQAYSRYAALLGRAEQSGKVITVELSPQLRGLEGRRVEVVSLDGETRRFRVGKSTGWLPIHLEVHNTRSTGGLPADKEYQSVRIIR